VTAAARARTTSSVKTNVTLPVTRVIISVWS